MAERETRIVGMAQALFLLNTLVWLGIAITTLARQVGVGRTVTMWVIAVLMFGNAAAMALSAAAINRRSKWMYFFALVVAVNILLTITDQFG